MKKKGFNNNVLVALLIVLGGAFALSRIFLAPQRERNLREALTDIDEAAITAIHIAGARQKGDITLTREGAGKDWKVAYEEKVADADTALVNSLLRAACHLNVKGLISRSKSDWKNVEVDDSAGVKVRLYEGDDEKADLRIGKTGFTQSRSGGMYTHVRRADENDVYSTDKLTRSSVDRDFNGWRSKAVLRLDEELISKVAITRADSVLVIQKTDSLWRVGEQKANLIAVKSYLTKLAHADAADFYDDFNPAGTLPLATLSIEGKGVVLATLKIWSAENTEDRIIASSLREGTYFLDRQGRLTRDLLIAKDRLLE